MRNSDLVGLEELIQANPNPVFVINTDYVVVGWNKSIELLTGYLSGEMLGTGNHWMPFYDERRPTMADLILKNPDNILDVYPGSSRAIIKNGYYAEAYFENLGKWLHFTAVPILDRNGDVVYAQETIEDITERKNVQENLYRTQERSRNIIESAKDGIIEVNSRGEITEFSKASEVLTGYLREDVLGKNVHDILPLPHKRKVVARYMQDLSEEAMSRIVGKVVETEIVNVDGKVLPVELGVGEPLYRNGEPYYVTIVRDISERKAAAEVEAILKEELHQARKNDALGRLAGGIAHDFNNILTGIVGCGELARMKTEDPAVKKHLDDMKEPLKRAQDLVSQIMTFSRKDDSEKYEIMDVSKIIDEAVKLLRATTPSTVEFDVSVEPDLRIATYSSALTQIVMNLAPNAVHAMNNKGKLKISLEHRLLLDKTEERKVGFNDAVVLEVGDTGVGIDEENLSRIFDPYYTTKQKMGGTGLGLSNVHNIVDKHCGKIFVDTKKGHGTTFSLFFKYIPEGAEINLNSLESNAFLRREGEVLLIEDEALNLNVGAAMIEEFGYTVVPMSNPVDALELLRQDPGRFEFVISDLNMPRMNGVELFEKAREVSSDVKMLLYTGDEKFLAEQKVVDVVLKKPFDMQSLEDAINAIISDE